MAIQISDLFMVYNRKVHALNNINIEIREGVFGLLGQNGAGKTTLMRILATLLKPTGGNVSLYGVDLCEKNYKIIKGMIGYLPQELGLYPNLTVYELLDYMGMLNELPKNVRIERIDVLLEQTNLPLHMNKKIKQLSGGMKRRVGLIQAMLNSPKILIVDEPTTGLDPEERIRVRNLLCTFAKERTVILSTHIVEDVASMCDNICILNKGRLNYAGTVHELLERTNGKVYTCMLQDDEALLKLKERFQIISNVYTMKGIETRFVSHEKPGFFCNNVDVSLEDAFIYLIGNRNI